MLTDEQLVLLSDLAGGADENSIVWWAPVPNERVLTRMAKIRTLVEALMKVDDELLDKILGLSNKFFDDPNRREW